MEVIDIADAELHLEQLINEVEQGKSFMITHNGVAIAQLIPPQNIHNPPPSK